MCAAGSVIGHALACKGIDLAQVSHEKHASSPEIVCTLPMQAPSAQEARQFASNNSSLVHRTPDICFLGSHLFTVCTVSIGPEHTPLEAES